VVHCFKPPLIRLEGVELIMSILQKLTRTKNRNPRKNAPSDEKSVYRYRRPWKTFVVLHATICILPLIIMTVVNYTQYKRTLQQEMVQPISHLTSNMKRVLAFFLEERRAALNFIVQERSLEELIDQDTLENIFNTLKRAFGGFIDIGLIDSKGRQRAYIGPFALLDRNYADQDWFHEVNMRGVHVSDMFTGYRNLPHFVIAVKHEKNNGDFFMLRATIDMEMLHEQIRAHSLKPSSDAFLINRDGVLQTPSVIYGNVLEMCTLPVPPFSEQTEVLEETDRNGNTYILTYSYILESPFIFMVITDPSVLNKSWFALRQQLLAFLVFSIVLILLLIIASWTYMVSRIREVDQKRHALMHEMEYTNKMASVGRLASGVAHEINNPLAIINEKAGLLIDLVTLSENFPNKDRLLKFADSIIQSVGRCSAITHRLLGFARHMDVEMQTVNLEHLMKEVLTFLEKEATYRNLSVNVHTAEFLPMIRSDRGQLQQVFLNLINNAFAAVADGGRIDIHLEPVDDANVSVTITDNGRGISEEHLDHIFEPFFTSNKNSGTGLGLSITYGIVGKLGGHISVESQLGHGTSFVIILPINK
jgi:signal transduction histidine kinase